DGLEWLLRLGVLWQQASAAPFRRTQQGGLFKRDVERLEEGPLLNGPPPDRPPRGGGPGVPPGRPAPPGGRPGPGGRRGRARARRAGGDGGLRGAGGGLDGERPRPRPWPPREGWRGGEPMPSNPYASAVLLALLLLGRLPPDAWLAPEALEGWLLEHHPYWA